MGNPDQTGTSSLSQAPADLSTSRKGRDTTTNISGHVIAVAGAASGIGRAAALRLAAAGAAVACLDRNIEGASRTAEMVRSANGIGVVGSLDVTKTETVDRVLRKVESTLGPLHALLNCVGITGMTNIRSHEVTLADFDLVYAVNLRGALALCQAALPGMVARGYGRILHLASIAGKEGNAGMVAYSATKAGLIGMVKTQGKEYAATGVTINALAPAVIHTPLVDAMPSEQVGYMTAKIPMGRLGKLDEAAELIAWILSPACSFTTGFTFDLSGGRAVY